MAKEESLKLRKKIKAKNPKFIAQDVHKRKRIRVRWKKPKGMQSKMRLKKRGYRSCVGTGYGSPKAVYGLDPSGMEMVNVSSPSQLENINKETQGIIISKTVGKKKRVAIINKAKEAGIKILNIKDTDAYVKKIEETMNKKKEIKQKKLKKKEEKKVKAEKKAEEKKDEDKLAEKVTEDEKKVEEKKEKDKLLTKKEK